MAIHQLFRLGHVHHVHHVPVTVAISVDITIPLDNPYNVGPPSYVCWFINPMNTSSLFAYHENHSEIGVINSPTERYRGRGPHMV